MTEGSGAIGGDRAAAGGGRPGVCAWVAMWTGVVVVVFVQVIPEVKRRQLEQALDAYEAAQRDEAQAGGEQAPGDDAAPTARWGRSTASGLA